MSTAINQNAARLQYLPAGSRLAPASSRSEQAQPAVVKSRQSIVSGPRANQPENRRAVHPPLSGARKKDVSDKQGDLRKDLLGAKNDLRKIKDEITNMADQVAHQEGRFQDLQADLADLKNRPGDHSADAASILKRTGEVKAQAESIHQSATAKRNETDKLQDRAYKLEERAEKLRASGQSKKAASLEKEATRLRERAGQVEKQAEALATRADKLAHDAETLMTDVRAMTGNIPASVSPGVPGSSLAPVAPGTGSTGTDGNLGRGGNGGTSSASGSGSSPAPVNNSGVTGNNPGSGNSGNGASPSGDNSSNSFEKMKQEINGNPQYQGLSGIDNLMNEAYQLSLSDKKSDQLKGQYMMEKAKAMFDAVSNLIRVMGDMQSKAINNMAR